MAVIEYVGYIKKSKKTDNVQDAHEAIRPTSILREPNSIKKYLTNDEFKLYNLIYKRTLSSLMSDAKTLQTTIVLDNNDYKFKATGSVITFDGYLKVYSEFCDEKFDAVISNPPYIRTSEIENLQKEVKLEPKIALDGGEDGLYFYKNICKNWISKLKTGGIMALEIGLGQENEVKNLMEKSGLHCIKTYKDINNIVRAISGIKKAAL